MKEVVFNKRHIEFYERITTSLSVFAACFGLQITPAQVTKKGQRLYLPSYKGEKVLFTFSCAEKIKPEPPTVAFDINLLDSFAIPARMKSAGLDGFGQLLVEDKKGEFHIVSKKRGGKNEKLSSSNTLAIFNENGLRNLLFNIINWVAEKYNLEVRRLQTMNNGFIDKFNIEFRSLDIDAENWHKRACELNLEPSWIGQPFSRKNEIYIITGLRPKSKRYPVIAKSLANHDRVAFSVSYIQEAMMDKE